MLSPNFPKNLLRQLAEIHGTPLLVGSRSCVREQLRRLRTALPRVGFLYAVKACDDPVLLRVLVEADCGFDVASFGEWQQVRQAYLGSGKSPSTEEPIRLLHSHPCKKSDDIRDSYANGLRRFVFDSADEIDKLCSLAPQARCLVRMNTPNRSGQVELSNRFGVEPSEMATLLRYASERKLVVDGLAFHVGSQAYDPTDFELAVRSAKDAWNDAGKLGLGLKYLDIGGGFPVSYRDRSATSIEEYGAHVARSLAAHFANKSVDFLAEPGRIIAAESVVLVASIVGVQQRAGKACYTLDDGRYGTFSGRYFTSNTFDFVPLVDSSSDIERAVIAGPTCDGGDIVADDYPLPKLRTGDLIAVPNVGAYGNVGASGFNGMPKAQRVWID